MRTFALCLSQTYTHPWVPLLIAQFAMGEKITISFEESVKERQGLSVSKRRQTTADKCSPTETRSLSGRVAVTEQKPHEPRPDVCRLQAREGKASCPLSQGQHRGTASN